MERTIDVSRRFYEEHVVPMIRERFAAHESRIAAGLAGEGSDCFGYDDLVSRDHDYGTGVCLWIPNADMPVYGRQLAAAYQELTDRLGLRLSARLTERRGVMTIHDFYSNILGIDCDTEACVITAADWERLDHTCLATAVNGEVFRDDTGAFSAFRTLLLSYYPDLVWRNRLAVELHRYAAALQVNYARCMTRGDVVAAGMCRLQGLDAAMNLYFLLIREYPPYYKWTYRRLTERDTEGIFSGLIRELSEAGCDTSVWAGKPYRPDYPNMSDPVVMLSERIAGVIVSLLRKNGLTDSLDPYLERYVDEVMR